MLLNPGCQKLENMTACMKGACNLGAAPDTGLCQAVRSIQLPGSQLSVATAAHISNMSCVQGGTVLVQVKGHFQMGGSGPLAMGPQGAGPPTAFQEDFTICLSSNGATYILKQCYTIL